MNTRSCVSGFGNANYSFRRSELPECARRQRRPCGVLGANLPVIGFVFGETGDGCGPGGASALPGGAGCGRQGDAVLVAGGTRTRRPGERDTGALFGGVIYGR